MSFTKLYLCKYFCPCTYRQTQSIAPQTHRWACQLKLNPEQLVILAELIAANNDATLQKIGVTISRSTIGRMTLMLNMTCKKKRCSHQPKAVKEFKISDMSSGSKSEN